MYKKPLDTRNINTKHGEMCETPCKDCDMEALKILRAEVETRKFGSRKRLSVKLRCKCDNCGLKQTVQLVEMP